MKLEKNDPLLTAYATGDLEDPERAAVEAQVQASPELQKEVDSVRRFAQALETAFSSVIAVEGSSSGQPVSEEPEDRLELLRAATTSKSTGRTKPGGTQSRKWLRWSLAAASVMIVLGLTVSLLTPAHNYPQLDVARVERQAKAYVPPANVTLNTNGTLSAGTFFFSNADSRKPLQLGEQATAQTIRPPQLKLIYNAQMSVTIKKEQAESFSAQLNERVRGIGGYVSQQTKSRENAMQPRGEITLRVPSDKLHEVMEWVGANATVARSSTAVEDITEQYVDVEARLANLQNAEGRLKELLAKATGKLEEVLKVEMQINEVRGQIEQLQGKKRLWDSQITFSTLSVSYCLADIYRATPPAAQTFGQRADRALRNSWENLVDFLQGLALFGVASLPWLPAVLVVSVPLWFLGRGLVRKFGKPAQAK